MAFTFHDGNFSGVLFRISLFVNLNKFKMPRYTLRVTFKGDMTCLI